MTGRDEARCEVYGSPTDTAFIQFQCGWCCSDYFTNKCNGNTQHTEEETKPGREIQSNH